MQGEQTRKRLLQKANELPLSPGVYLMRDKGGRVIYVGKSRKLKNRVSQYFQNGEKQIKTARMVSLVEDFDYFLCSTEIEALTLENTLIKQYTPRYNIRLKDAKSYPYIKVTAEPYPRLQFTRTRLSDKARYFGPYSGTSVVHTVLHTLQKTLRLPSCGRQFPRDIGKERPCLYYQMGQCCGVCTGKVSEQEYGELVRLAISILRGDTAQAQKMARGEMERAAGAEEFEKAAAWRDTLFALQKLSQKQQVVAAPGTAQDVFGFYEDDFSSALSIFYVRDGALIDKQETVFGADGITDEGALLSLLYEHYRFRSEIPPKILLSFAVSEEELAALSAYLSERAGHRVEISVPKRGDGKTLCALAVSNAKERAAVALRERQKTDEAQVSLASLLSLDTLPERIESYDVSNFGAEHKTCGMIVYENGKFQKNDYRVFKIREIDGTDDYACMRQALSRRFAHASDEGGAFSVMPDLILLDGGKTHVAMAKQLFCELGVSVPVFGMVKDEYHKTRALCTDTSEISIARDKSVFSMIYRIQEEVHRFSVRQMSAAKASTLKHSVLEKIPGVGAKKAKQILTHFGGLAAVRKADVRALEKAPGVGPALAKTIYDYFHTKGE